MTRTRLLIGTLALAVAATAPGGVAIADGQSGSPSPGASPGGTSTTSGSSGSTTGTSAPPSLAGASGGATAASPAANQAPVAGDDTATVVAGSRVVIDVLGNDTDDGLPDGSTLSVVGTDTLGGRVTHRATDVSFTARAADRGRFTFTYDVSDGELGDTGTVTVTVTAPPPPRARTVSLTMPGQVVALRRSRLSGGVDPAKPGPVSVLVQRRTPSGWTRVGQVRAGRGGGYSVGFTTNRPASYTFRAVATWGDKKKATSATLTRQVVAQPDVVVSGPLTRRAVRYSFRSGCPVGPGSLRKITMNRYTYSGLIARGTLVVNAGAVGDLRQIFTAAFSARFPLRSMRPSESFYAGGRRTPTQSDLAAMRADNTSAFNCRPVTGNPYRVSQHSYGNAIDINTVRNPYVVGRRVYPSFAGAYLNRSRYRTGMILRGSVIAAQMSRFGWPWGARWSDPDYQHFSSNGG